MAACPNVSALEKSLSSLSDGELADIVCNAFSRCSHRQQVRLMDECLPAYLRRDFLSLLPPELVLKILSYIDLVDLCRCLLVSKNWNKVITDNEQVWRYHCQLMGVSSLVEVAELHKYSSYTSFAVTVVKVRKMIQRGKLSYYRYPNRTGNASNATLTCYHSGAVTNVYFINHEVYGNANFGNFFLSIRFLNEVQDTVELASVPVSNQFRIMWLNSSPRYVLIHGSDGSWLRTDITKEVPNTRTNIWHDCIYGVTHYELSSCPECCLIGIVPKSINDREMWEFTLNQLEIGCTEPLKLQSSFSFLPIDRNQSIVFFQIHKLVMLPSSSCSKDKNGFCTSHTLLFQFSACICMFSLKVVSNSRELQTIVLENIVNLCPSNDHAYYNTPSILGHKFFLSADNRLAAYCVDGDFCVWDLHTREVYGWKKKRTHFPIIIVDCVAVGYVFSIVYSRETRTIIVVSTVTGEFLFQHQMSDTWDDPLYAPIDQQWLNNLDVDKEELPLAITLSDWKNPGLLSCASPNIHEEKQ